MNPLRKVIRGLVCEATEKKFPPSWVSIARKFQALTSEKYINSTDLQSKLLRTLSNELKKIIVTFSSNKDQISVDDLIERIHFRNETARIVAYNYENEFDEGETLELEEEIREEDDNIWRDLDLIFHLIPDSAKHVNGDDLLRVFGDVNQLTFVQNDKNGKHETKCFQQLFALAKSVGVDEHTIHDIASTIVALARKIIETRMAAFHAPAKKKRSLENLEKKLDRELKKAKQKYAMICGFDPKDVS